MIMKKRIEKVTFESTLTKFGKGLFETIKVQAGRALLLDEHLDRLFNSMIELNFQLELAREEVKDEINYACKEMDYKALRLSVCDEGYNLSFRDITYGPEDYQQGFWLCVSPVKRGRSPLYFHKTSNYLENIFSLENAKKKGYDEALFLNYDDMLLEGSISNIFFIKGDELHTPHLDQGILPGIIRDKVVEAAKILGIEVKTREISYKEVFVFDFCFITNSLMELMKVRGIENFDYNRDLNYNRDNDIFVALNRKTKELYYG